MTASPLNIADLVRLAGDNSRDHGFHEDRPTILDPSGSLDAWRGNRLMLIVGEVAEAHEEIRNGNGTEAYYTDARATRWQDQEHTPRGLPLFKPEGLPSELADIVIRAADLCYTEGIDLEAAILDKMAYNATRPHKHGKQF